MDMTSLIYEPITKNIIKKIKDYEINISSYDIEHIELLNYQLFSEFGITYDDYIKCVRNDKSRYKRCYDRINYYFKNYEFLYFGTLTFNEENINNESYCFKQYKRVLTKLGFQYIVNRDIGDKTSRVHYHIIIAAHHSLTKDNLSWSYGFTDLKKIFYKDRNNITKYLLKLTNHSFKDSTFKRVVYSRLNKDK